MPGRVAHAAPNKNFWSPHGDSDSTDHQRPGAGEHVCPRRARLHDGLRHHQPDQFRPWRDPDGRRDGQLDHRHRAGRLRPARLAVDAHRPGLRHRRVCRAELLRRKDRLPAAAQRASAGAADHGDGHVAAAAGDRDDHLEAQPQALPAAAAHHALRPRRAGDHGHAVPDPGPDGRHPRGADVPGELHQAGPRDASHRREPACGRADGRQARLHHLHHLRHRRGTRGRRRPDVGGQLRHGAAHHGLHAGPEGLHGGGAGRHRQPRRCGGGWAAAGPDRGHRCGLPR
mmetsp:Transcript_20391/g.78174  ORF Transcript_20391/g.78174 Transcript_20391/m.78174 type:complete len:285 (-) Transcript_20391:88-942(-)